MKVHTEYKNPPGGTIPGMTAGGMAGIIMGGGAMPGMTAAAGLNIIPMGPIWSILSFLGWGWARSPSLPPGREGGEGREGGGEGGREEGWEGGREEGREGEREGGDGVSSLMKCLLTEAMKQHSFVHSCQPYTICQVGSFPGSTPQLLICTHSKISYYE